MNKKNPLPSQPAASPLLAVCILRRASAVVGQGCAAGAPAQDRRRDDTRHGSSSRGRYGPGNADMAHRTEAEMVQGMGTMKWRTVWPWETQESLICSLLTVHFLRWSTVGPGNAGTVWEHCRSSLFASQRRDQNVGLETMPVAPLTFGK